MLNRTALVFAALVVTASAALAADAVSGADLLAKKAEFNGKTVTADCMLMVADESMGSMCAFKGAGNVMLDAKSWTPETKKLVMETCNPATVEKFCTITVSGTVDAAGPVVTLKNASAVKK